MKTRPFGAGGPPVPAVGQGTWAMERSPREAVRALVRGFDLGMTHVDTAEMYGDGRVEEIAGRAIAAWGRRDELFVVSKVLPENATRRGTVAACERSLRRLGVEHLDCYLLHWREGRTPLAETFAAFDELVAAGKIRRFGVSNFDVDDLEEAWALAPGRIACNQVFYSLTRRAVEHAVLPWCRGHGVALVAYSPLGGEGEVAPRMPGVDPATALAFLLREEGGFVIPKSARVAHVEENARAGALTLDEATVRRLDRAFPRGRSRRLPML